jgi:adenylosuccinate lyase
MAEISAISVLDGRYAKLTKELGDIFSEYGLIKSRVYVEIQWLKFLASELQLVDLSEEDLSKIDTIALDFSLEDAEAVKGIEKITNHDVKAVEYFIKEKLMEMGLTSAKEWVHFSCTSEDINNTSYALMLKEGREVTINILSDLLSSIEELGKKYKSVPMMSRTHGQPASPTTVGKEFINYAWRIREEIIGLKGSVLSAKFNGATGNYNAHCYVFPDIDWIDNGSRFISDYLGLKPLLFTTQINPYSYISSILHSMIRISSIIIDLDKDMWGYISIGYFKQRLKEGEVGSSTMPHKVNPIDFENSEGNMGIAISMMDHLAVKLLQSRFQRDLSDSTALRNLGSIFGYFLIGMKNLLKGLKKIDLNISEIEKDLSENLELLAEPIQTAMRYYGEDDPYEKLKQLTRGKKITNEVLAGFIDSLENVPEEFRKKMKNTTVHQYTGLAEKLVNKYFAK